MKSVLLNIFLLGAFMVGIAAAQNNATQTPQSPSAPQTSTPAPPQTPAATSETEPQPQTPRAAASQNPTVLNRVASGSVIPVELTKGIDAKKLKPGDEVVAKVTEDMKTNTGMVLVPKDTKVVGHVTEAQPRTKEQKESELGIEFDRALIKNGSEMQMPMSIQAVIAPPNPDGSNASANVGQQSSGMAGTPTPSMAGERSPGMGGGTPSLSTSVPNMPSTGGMSSDGQNKLAANSAITAKTEGVVGISSLKLTTTSANSGQGSLLISEKHNVKLESGTFMLLRVN